MSQFERQEQILREHIRKFWATLYKIELANKRENESDALLLLENLDDFAQSIILIKKATERSQNVSMLLESFLNKLSQEDESILELTAVGLLLGNVGEMVATEATDEESLAEYLGEIADLSELDFAYVRVWLRLSNNLGQRSRRVKREEVVREIYEEIENSKIEVESTTSFRRAIARIDKQIQAVLAVIARDTNTSPEEITFPLSSEQYAIIEGKPFFIDLFYRFGEIAQYRGKNWKELKEFYLSNAQKLSLSLVDKEE